MTIAAVVPCAGYSSRMGMFKPLLPLGKSTVLGTCLDSLRLAGVSHIVVATGNHADDVAAEAVRHGAVPTFNREFTRGMFTSIRAGLVALPSDVNTILILPCDIPLVRPQTIARLLHDHAAAPASIRYPSFLGQRGHPPLIDRELLPAIMAHSGKGGLRALLADHDGKARETAVADGRVLFDLDLPDDYTLALDLASRDHPDEAECLALWELMDLPETTRAHCRAVAGLARDMAVAVNESKAQPGRLLDVGLVRSAALVHDLAKGSKDHALRGAQLLAEYGFTAAAPLVEHHPDLSLPTDGRLGEAEIVFLADKLIQDDKPVPLAGRYQAKLARFGHLPDAKKNIQARLDRALSVAARYRELVGRRGPKIHLA